MVVASLIERKRDGEELTPEEWRGMLEAYGADHIPDYQMAALLMAVFHKVMRVVSNLERAGSAGHRRKVRIDDHGDQILDARRDLHFGKGGGHGVVPLSSSSAWILVSAWATPSAPARRASVRALATSGRSQATIWAAK